MPAASMSRPGSCRTARRSTPISTIRRPRCLRSPLRPWGSRTRASNRRPPPAGTAYGLTGLMRALPVHAARGLVFLPADALRRHGTSLRSSCLRGRTSDGLGQLLAELRATAREALREAEALIAELDISARTAFVPLSLVDPYLAAIGEESGATRCARSPTSIRSTGCGAWRAGARREVSLEARMDERSLKSWWRRRLPDLSAAASRFPVAGPDRRAAHLLSAQPRPGARRRCSGFSARSSRRFCGPSRSTSTSRAEAVPTPRARCFGLPASRQSRSYFISSGRSGSARISFSAPCSSSSVSSGSSRPPRIQLDLLAVQPSPLARRRARAGRCRTVRRRPRRHHRDAEVSCSASTYPCTAQEHVLTVSLCFVAPVSFLAFAPRSFTDPITAREEDDFTMRAAAALVKFVLVPLLLVYTAILYAYAIKIVLAWELPKGTLGGMVVGYLLVGAATLLVGYPSRESGGRSRPPVLALLGGARRASRRAAVHRRRPPYRRLRRDRAALSDGADRRLGADPRRHPSSCAARDFDLRLVPGVLAFLMFAASFGPGGVIGLSVMSQKQQLAELLTQ